MRMAEPAVWPPPSGRGHRAPPHSPARRAPRGPGTREQVCRARPSQRACARGGEPPMSRRERWPPHIPSRRPFGTEDAGPGRGWVAPPRSASGAVASPERLLGCTHLVPGTAANTHGRQKPSLARERRVAGTPRDRSRTRAGAEHAPGSAQPQVRGSRSAPGSRRPPEWRQRTMPIRQVGGGAIACAEALPRRLSRTGRSSSRRSRTMSCCTRRYASVSSACWRSASSSLSFRVTSSCRASRRERIRPNSVSTASKRGSVAPATTWRAGSANVARRISGSWPQSVQATTVLPRCRARGGRGTTQRSPTTLARSPSRLRSRSARVLERYPTVDSVVRSALRDPS